MKSVVALRSGIGVLVMREAKTAAVNASQNAAAAHKAALAKAQPEAESPHSTEPADPGDSDSDEGEGASLTGGHSEQ